MKKFYLKAYTLLELMIVLTIIGILMAIGTAIYSRALASAKKVTAEQAMAQYQSVIMNFKIDNGREPADVQELLTGGYINKALSIDPWKDEYKIEHDEANGVTKIISAGPDKKFGTQDDIIKDINL